MASWHIFISYSRKDTEIVSPLTDFLRIGGRKIFRDEDSIPAGKRWSMVIEDSIASAKTLVLFWSQNSANSDAVMDECSIALRNSLDIVPIILDNTKLTEELAVFQWLDFRPLICAITGQYPPKTGDYFGGATAGFLTGSSIGRLVGGFVGGIIGRMLAGSKQTPTTVEELLSRIPDQTRMKIETLFDRRILHGIDG